MVPRTLEVMREGIRKRQYVMTLHAEEEMDDDGLSIYDVESIILTGTIGEQQRDIKTKDRKYLVRGRTLNSESTAIVVSKFGLNGKLIILTVYAE